MGVTKRFAYLLGHDSIDGWPHESRRFTKAWAAREILEGVLSAQPGSVGIVAKWDDETERWVKYPDFAGLTAREWWDSVAQRESPGTEPMLFEIGGAS